MNIGITIRNERKARGLSLKGLAEGCGLSPMTLQRIETGKTSPSVATLAEIAHRLLRPIDFFIKEEEPKIRILKQPDLQVVETPRMTLKMIAPIGLIDENIFVNLGEGKAGKMIDSHVEEGYSFVYMLEGGCIFEHDGIKHELSEGDAMYYNASYPHSVVALGDPHRFISIFFKKKK
jgi:transcriptional regulator with XRE-family HTH domain